MFASDGGHPFFFSCLSDVNEALGIYVIARELLSIAKSRHTVSPFYDLFFGFVTVRAMSVYLE